MQTDFTITIAGRPLANGEQTFQRYESMADMPNNDLKFALDVLMLQNSPRVEAVLDEIQKRIERGAWLDLDKPTPAKESLPAWLKVWPFCLLWAQRPR